MISDATALICLSRISKLDLLKKVYKIILIPPAVKEEVLIEDKDGYISIYNAIKGGWLKVINPKRKTKIGLGAGEEQAINLAIEKKDGIILDDAVAIKAAKAFGINAVRTTTVIFAAMKKRIITEPEVLKILSQLIEIGYYISSTEYSILISKLK
ncbi:hypothetical protein HYV80_07360 [Candidatus Woesearchaeota archaeon]|nr:hypothetical protein [Candidatus Woesearchaeota archaeon]